MSRFYEALTEASRLRGQSPDAGKRPVKPFSAHQIELPPIEAEPQIRNGDGSEASLKTDEAPAPGVEEFPALSALGEELLGPAKKTTSVGVAAPMKLDPQVRVLPQVVDPVIVAQYGLLRTKLLQLQPTKPFRIVLVASPLPGDGKTVTLMNLAFSFAMLPSYKVLIVDGDLRKGSVGKWMGIDDRPGLSNLVDGSATLDQVVVTSDDYPLCVLPRGNSPVPAAELLNSPDLTAHFRRMADHFDLLLIDSPPATLVPDTQLLATACDGVLLVARAYQTRRKSLEKAAQDLQRFRVLGAVLNGGSRPVRTAKDYYYRAEAAAR